MCSIKYTQGWIGYIYLCSPFTTTLHHLSDIIIFHTCEKQKILPYSILSKVFI